MTDRDPLLAKTPLYALHLEQGAKMVPFAGYAMPVQYPLGVKKEHLHTREQAGLFDVSHMGQVLLRGSSAAAQLERLVPVDICDLPEGKQRYALFTNAAGGILDDLMVSNLGDSLLVVVNAACKAQDIAHLRSELSDQVTIEELANRALLALQGPQAATIMARLAPETSSMVFMDFRAMRIDGIDCFIGRAGYTGEDGFEISVPADQAEQLARRLLSEPEVELIGLGARDSLRLEAGLCLYGHDIDATTTPAEASLIWAISPCRRVGGARQGGFPGADTILEQLQTKNLTRKRVGLVSQSRAPVREGTELVDKQGQAIGTVTSGTMGPTAGVPVAMAYVDSAHATIDAELFAMVRGKPQAMNVARMPFVPQRYHRG